MESVAAGVLIERWIEDPAFRERMRSDAVAAATELGAEDGVELSDEDREYLAALDWTLADEELEPLLEKRMGYFC